MGKVEDIIEISKVLEIEVGTSNGSTLTKEWLIIFHVLFFSYTKLKKN